jgi:uncharacterized radical SAM superfamily Fe-S cluster-containing enzyme
MLTQQQVKKVLRSTKSICPECFKVVDANIFVDEKDVVKIGKNCPTHGYFEDTYTFSSLKLYLWAEKYAKEGKGLENPRTESLKGCPYDCGLCPNHKSHTVLAIIDITNRCNLRCPICFANAAASGYVYELTLEQIREIMENFMRNSPVKPPALQLSGGEPTVREDLPTIVSMAKEVGFRHVEVNTNGIRFANDIEFFKKVKEAGMDTIYLQFDGLENKIYESSRGAPLLDIKLKVIENARKIGFDSIVLVVTLVKGVNDSQLGRIIEFALENSDVIRCVNVQPVSITGRIDRKSREAMRINTSDFMELVEKQTNGLITIEDFRPVPSVVPISRAVGALKGKHYVEFTTSPFCGVATFLLKDKNDKWVPITRLADVDKFFEVMEKIYNNAINRKRIRASLRLISTLMYIKPSLVKSLVWTVLKEGSYEALGKFMRNVVMIGCMHFMDPYNFDLQRMERCVIHYGLPDGTIRPFCSYNSIHRPLVEQRFSIPYEEWKEKK